MARIDLATQFTDVRARVDTQPAAATTNEGDGPKYRRFTRKETLLRADQLVDLSALARFRMKKRRVRTERITENTLVRIAVDLLLDNQDLLDGSTEDEIRSILLGAVARLADRSQHAPSLSTPRSSVPPDSGTSTVRGSGSPEDTNSGIS
jgi:hypothetical protein